MQDDQELHCPHVTQRPLFARPDNYPGSSYLDHQALIFTQSLRKHAYSNK